VLEVNRLRKFLSDGRGVTASTGTALLARLAAAATTILAMPVALHSLGERRFGTFLLLFGVINWLALGNFGVHSALGRAIAAKEIGKEDVPEMLGSAVLYAAATSAVTAVAVAWALVAWVRTAGARQGLPAHELLVAGFCMLVLSFFQVALQTFEGVQIGNLEIYRANLTRLAGSAFTFLCLLLLPRVWNSIAVFVLALNGGVLLGSLLNAGMVLKRVGIRFSCLRRNADRMQRMAISGLAFLAIGAASLLQTHVPVLILATMRGPAEAVDFGLFIRLLFVLMSALAMVTTPLWPAIMRARAESDYEWIRKSVRLAGALVVGTGICAMMGLVFFGRKVLWLWTGRVLQEPPLFAALFGVYFLQMAWSHYWAIVLIGFGRERLVASLLGVEGILILVAGALLTRSLGPTGMILGAVIALAAVSNWSLPLLARRAAGEASKSKLLSSSVSATSELCPIEVMSSPLA